MGRTLKTNDLSDSGVSDWDCAFLQVEEELLFEANFFHFSFKGAVHMQYTTSGYNEKKLFSLQREVVYFMRYTGL